jgi:DNA invertase Pin-like site-specific DNA recombinase
MTASGELIFTIFSALARFERRLIQERQRTADDRLQRRWYGPIAVANR